MADVAADLGVAWGTIMAVVVERGQTELAGRNAVAASGIGVDETAFLRVSRAHHTRFVTAIVDLTPDQPARLLDVVPGRSAGALSTWLAGQPPQWKAGIVTASLDPFRGHATGLTAELLDAVRVLDPFRVCRLALRAVDLVRRRNQVDLFGHRGRARDQLYAVPRLLLRRHDRHTLRPAPPG